MGYDKGHQEFHGVDMKEGFHTVPGYPRGFSRKFCAGSLDEKNKVGNRTRLLKIEAGRVLDRAVRARLLGGGVRGARAIWFAATTRRARAASSPSRADLCLRPPGVYHGPFTSKNGCLLLRNRTTT